MVGAGRQKLQVSLNTGEVPGVGPRYDDEPGRPGGVRPGPRVARRWPSRSCGSGSWSSAGALAPSATSASRPRWPASRSRAPASPTTPSSRSTPRSSRSTARSPWSARSGCPGRPSAGAASTRSTGLVDVDLREVFEVRPIDGETYPIEGDEVDLEPVVRDAALLNLPLAVLCRADCAGPGPEALPVVVAGEEPRSPAGTPAGPPWTRCASSPTEARARFDAPGPRRYDLPAALQGTRPAPPRSRR